MQFSKKEGVGGNWLDVKSLVSGTQVCLATETKVVTNTFQGKEVSQNVAKIKVKGATELQNTKINQTSINALVEAFGPESKDWVGKVLTAKTEVAQVGGKRRTILYLVPEGFEVSEDADGYVKVLRKGQATAQTPAVEPEPEAEEEIMPEDLPFN